MATKNANRSNSDEQIFAGLIARKGEMWVADMLARSCKTASESNDAMSIPEAVRYWNSADDYLGSASESIERAIRATHG
jgi:hypothetical protein